MEFNPMDLEKVTNRTRRLFQKYQQDHQLSHGQATGKVLYELENTFDTNPLFELYAYAELYQINTGQPEVLEYLKTLIIDWVQTHFRSQTDHPLHIHDLHKQFQSLHQDLHFVFH